MTGRKEEEKDEEGIDKYKQGKRGKTGGDDGKERN